MLPWVCALTQADSIIDFGGSSGWAFDYLKSTLPSHFVSSYVVVELNRIVEHMQATGLHTYPVSYTIGAGLAEHCKVLYSNSVLQYFESNSEMLNLIKKTAPTYILLDDLVAKGEDDFFSTQMYYGIPIPYRFLGLQRLISDFSCCGYTLLACAPFPSPILGVIQHLPMENFPEKFRIRYPLTALFKHVRP